MTSLQALSLPDPHSCSISYPFSFLLFPRRTFFFFFCFAPFPIFDVSPIPHFGVPSSSSLHLHFASQHSLCGCVCVCFCFFLCCCDAASGFPHVPRCWPFGSAAQDFFKSSCGTGDTSTSPAPAANAKGKVEFPPPDKPAPPTEGPAKSK